MQLLDSAYITPLVIIYVGAQFYLIGLNFNSLYFKLIIIHYHTPKQIKEK